MCHKTKQNKTKQRLKLIFIRILIVSRAFKYHFKNITVAISQRYILKKGTLLTHQKYLICHTNQEYIGPIDRIGEKLAVTNRL